MPYSNVNTLIVTGPVIDRSRLLLAVASRTPGRVITNRDGSTFTGRETVRNFDLDKIVHQPADQEDNWSRWRTENWGTPYNTPTGAEVSCVVDAERYTYTIPLDGVLSRKVIHTLAENFITLRFELKLRDHTVVVYDRGVISGEYQPYPRELCHECGVDYDACSCNDDEGDESDASDDPLEN